MPQPAGTRRAVDLVDQDGRRLSLHDATRSHETDPPPEPAVRAPGGASHHVHVAITRPYAHALSELCEIGASSSVRAGAAGRPGAHHAPHRWAGPGPDGRRHGRRRVRAFWPAVGWPVRCP
ncbi:hypothetical protein ACFSL4_08465 [Streptomyces caeni]|uniref:Uncharacterized protein n=1 Tax=Streptomyces caeni TaxID=2307231 RepID=A0ABW4ILT0_9ACTN